MANFITSALGIQLAEFSVPSITEEAAITDVRPLASYSWIQAQEPTMIVPGAPPTWTNVCVTQVPQDYGTSFIDQNAAQMHSGSPLEPLFVAVEEMGEHEVLPQHQFICDRNTLKKLLEWVTMKPSDNLKDFRIDVDLAGSTCLLAHMEKDTTEFILRGYRYEYGKAATTWPAWSEGATEHYRIISLKLAGIPIVVRFKVDGCISLNTKDNSNKSSQGTKSTTPTMRTALIRRIIVMKSPDPLAPQSSLLEIEICLATQRKVNWNDVYPRIFLSQTPSLYIARHYQGRFRPVGEYPLAGRTLDRHARKTKASAGKLKVLLQAIHSSVMEQGAKTGLTLVCIQGRLRLYQRKGGKEISREVLHWFAT